VRGTPSLFVNNRPYEGKGVSLEEYIVSELSR